MKIAVTYENGDIFQHFGRTEQFKVYDITDGKVTSAEIVSTNGNGHGALAGILSELKADTLICGGIGAGAQAALSNTGITLYGGVSGNADKAVKHCLQETLTIIQMSTVTTMDTTDKNTTVEKINTTVQGKEKIVNEQIRTYKKP